MTRAAQSPPTGFVCVKRGPVVLVAEAAFATPLERLGLLEPGALARALAGAGGPSGRGRLAVLPLEGRRERLCLRPLHRGGWLGPWLPGALGSLERPLAELAATLQLRAAGAPVPQPLCVLAEKRRDRRFDSAVGSVFEEGAMDALQFLESEPPRDRLLHAAAAAGAAVRRFHDAGGCHADLHLKNLLIRESEGGFDVLVIDLDRARVVARVSPRTRLAELMRLYRSLHKRRLLARVGPRGCARFFAAYVDGDRTFRRALRKGLAWERLLLGFHTLAYR